MARSIIGLAWTPDSRELVFSCPDKSATLFSNLLARLWRIPVQGSSATPELLVGVTDGATQPAISRPTAGAPARLAYVRHVTHTSIRRAEMIESGRLQQGAEPLITSTRLDITPQISPDGKRVAFASDRSGSYEIYICDVGGRNVAQLTSTRSNARAPRWSPDGSKIAFDARIAGLADIFVVGVDGRPPSQLTFGPADDVRPSWSKDGRWIYFRSDRSGTTQIWKVSSNGGTPVQVTRNGAHDALESPDGTLLFFVKSGVRPGLWSVPVDGGEERPVLDSVWQSYWAVAESGICFLDLTGGLRLPKPIRFFDFRTRQTRDIGTVQNQLLYDSPSLSISSDGRRIVWAQVDQSYSDLMLIDRFR